MNKFEQLIEYVINDEDAKARELFHDIVVEKSRQIYEEMMEEEAITEESTEDEDEKAEKAGEKVTKDLEYDDKKDRAEKKMDEAMDDLGGDQADDLIDDIEVEEEGISMEGEDDDDMDDDHHDDMGGNEELEDRVVDLEDKLDELMAEFEALMGQDDAQDETDMDMDMDMEVGDNGDDMTDIEIDDDEMETEGMMRMPMEEAINLKAAPAPVKSEEAGINKKSTVAANSGARGAMAQPVKMTGDTAQGRPAPGTKDLIGKVQNTPAQGTVKQEPATKPHLAQATGVNTKTPFPKS
jgi:hypothetical protein